MGKLSGKTVLVTGGGRGIGAATGLLFAQEGASVVITSRDATQLKSTADDINNEVGSESVFPIRADVSDESQVEALFNAAFKKLGPVDILVNNAGIVRVADFLDHDPTLWDEVMNINLRGAYLCSRAAFLQMKGRGGNIINISSLSGIRGLPKFKGFSSYVVSKFGLVGLTESLAVEGRELGIRVNCLAPGAVDTQLLRDASPHSHLKTSAQPEDIAKMILFLADDEQTGKMSGSVIEFDTNE